ncbi:MAG: M23 family metallopeptidase [Bacteroidales bacterium]|nr:M23 family metallopeptidase [Bacteroidales bacterium]
MSGKYIFDKDNYKFKKAKTSVWAVIRKILMFFVGTLSMAVLYYVIFALVFSTEEERRLRQENRLFEKEIPELEKKEKLLADVVEGLKIKDDGIYEEVFHTSAPSMDRFATGSDLEALDSIPVPDITKLSASRLAALKQGADSVEANFQAIMKTITDSGFVMPPMTHPFETFSYAQTGASVGNKINPFYKVNMTHNGLDLIAPEGVAVLAAADGVVKEVVKSTKGLGNVVVIDHGNGYVTRYAHLADVVARKGRKVKRGTKIGNVGVSGNSFAPHLHYEVHRDTLVLDPVHYLFASVTPEAYLNMVIMSVSAGQSMD